jgi:thioredoxin reductase
MNPTNNQMSESKFFDVIIIGGSYAGLSAAMALGRSLRRVLIIDSGLPCNRQTPHSHNFVTHDGEIPSVIAEKAKSQVMKYDTVAFHHGVATEGKATDTGFAIRTQSGEEFNAQKLIFATGVIDIMPDIDGFSECWGTSILHCPYCHGYEVKGVKTGILANGFIAYHLGQLIRNWTKDLTIFTNGESSLTKDQTEQLAKHKIPIIEKEVASLRHENGYINQIIFSDQSTFDLKAIYAHPDIEQHCKIPEQLGCEFTNQGLLYIDSLHKTSVHGVFACGDSTSPLRSVANAVATGNLAGAAVNNTMLEESF